MEESVKTAVADMIRRYGPAVCDDVRKCEGLLKDLCGPHPREIRVLSEALREGVPARLRQAAKANEPMALVIGRLAQQLDDLGNKTEDARWAVEVWASALGLSVPLAKPAPAPPRRVPAPAPPISGSAPEQRTRPQVSSPPAPVARPAPARPPASPASAPGQRSRSPDPSPPALVARPAPARPPASPASTPRSASTPRLKGKPAHRAGPVLIGLGAVVLIALAVGYSSRDEPAADVAPETIAPILIGGIEWMRLQGGTFRMGSADGSDDEKPVHEVELSGLELARTETTVRQYRACVAAGACSEPRSSEAYDNWGKSGREDHPVNGVNWDQAVAFCRWTGGRLPTEAEWEYAARSGGKDWKYPWGDAQATCAYTVMDEGGIGCGEKRTWPVCSKARGNTEQGLCDLAGNVWEWVSDWYDAGYYGRSPRRNPSGSSSGSHRVVRGGSFGYGATYLRASNRNDDSPGDAGFYLGFRCARSTK